MAHAGRGRGRLADVGVDDVHNRGWIFIRGRPSRDAGSLLPPKRLFPDRPSTCISSTAPLSCYSQFCARCPADRDLRRSISAGVIAPSFGM